MYIGLGLIRSWERDKDEDRNWVARWKGEEVVQVNDNDCCYCYASHSPTPLSFVLRRLWLLVVREAVASSFPRGYKKCLVYSTPVSYSSRQENGIKSEREKIFWLCYCVVVGWLELTWSVLIGAQLNCVWTVCLNVVFPFLLSPPRKWNQFCFPFFQPVKVEALSIFLSS